MAPASSSPPSHDGRPASHGDDTTYARDARIAPKHATGPSDLTAVAVAAAAASLNASDIHEHGGNSGYRGRCLYKTGKCENERALKTNGQAHNLCDMHRLRQNQNQRKLDGKNRHNRTAYSPYERSTSKPASPSNSVSTPADPVKHEPSTVHSPRSSEDSYIAPKTTVELPPRTSNRHYLPPPPQVVSHPQSPPLKYAPQFPTSTLPTTSAFPSLPHMRRSTSQPTLHYDVPPPQQTSQPVKAEAFTDDITVPTPSYLKGEAREAFRSRVLQKLVNIISEEVMTTTHHHLQPPPSQPSYEMAHPEPFAPHSYHHQYAAAAASHGYPSSYASAPLHHQPQPHYTPSAYHPHSSPPRGPVYDDHKATSFYQHRMPPRLQSVEGNAAGPLPKLFPAAMPTSSSATSLPSIMRPPPKESVSPNNRSYLI